MGSLPDNRPPREIVRERASRSGWKGRQWRCLQAIVYRESRWNPQAVNKHSSARGLFQILRQEPGLPVDKQAKLGIKYIKNRYGTPCEALTFHIRHGYY